MSRALNATLSGRPLYATAGYEVLQAVEDDSGGVPVPLLKMGKSLAT